MLTVRAAILAALCVSSGRAMRMPTRRAAIGTLAAAAASGTAPVFAKDSTTKRLASGFEVQKSNGRLKYEADKLVYEPFVSALAKKDTAGLAALYTPDATFIDATSRPFTSTTGASTIGDYLVKAGFTNPTCSITKTTGEHPYDGSAVKTVHTQYIFEADGGVRFTGYCRLVSPDGESWKIDRAIAGLEDPKAYAKLKPKRDVLGNVFMEVEL